MSECFEMRELEQNFLMVTGNLSFNCFKLMSFPSSVSKYLSFDSIIFWVPFRLGLVPIQNDDY